MANNKDVLFKELPGVGGKIGLITLNRPEYLNAITYGMCKEINLMLLKWSTAEHIKAIVIHGTGDRAFSAGGDIKYLYESGKAHKYASTRQFFWEEYRLNHRIHNYPKPFIGLLDGITMGGGVGVSIHGSHRVVTEHFLFAMPETSIGFFPDIGGTYFLSRCPGETGIYLGLTGSRLNAAEAVYAEIADHIVASNHLNEIVLKLAKAKFNADPFASVTEILDEYSVAPETPKLSVYRDMIDECFCFDTVEEIMRMLQKKNRKWHVETIKELLKKSPTSLKVTLKALRKGITLDFEACMQMEFRLCQHFLHGHDFYEGVRASLIDRDNNPRWKPNRLGAINDKEVEAYFASQPEGDLFFEEVAQTA